MFTQVDRGVQHNLWQCGHALLLILDQGLAVKCTTEIEMWWQGLLMNVAQGVQVQASSK